MLDAVNLQRLEAARRAANRERWEEALASVATEEEGDDEAVAEEPNMPRRRFLDPAMQKKFDSGKLPLLAEGIAAIIASITEEGKRGGRLK